MDNAFFTDNFANISFNTTLYLRAGCLYMCELQLQQKEH